MQRTERKLPQETKEKISKSLLQKHAKQTAEHRRKISNSLKRYWSGIPYSSGGGDATIQDIML